MEEKLIIKKAHEVFGKIPFLIELRDRGSLFVELQSFDGYTTLRQAITMDVVSNEEALERALVCMLQNFLSGLNRH